MLSPVSADPRWWCCSMTPVRVSSHRELILKPSKLLVNISHKLLEQFLCLNGIKTYRAILPVISLMPVLVSQWCDLTCSWIHLPGQIPGIDISLSLVFSLSHTCPQTLPYDTYKGTAGSASSRLCAPLLTCPAWGSAHTLSWNRIFQDGQRELVLSTALPLWELELEQLYCQYLVQLD